MEPNLINIKRFDGNDEIVFSEVFNLYENTLSIKDLYGFNFTFVFEDNLPALPSALPQKDVAINGQGKDVTITFSAKLRNTLGSGTSTKIPIVTFKDGKSLLFSVYSSKVGDNTSALNVSVSFYLRTL